MQLLLACVIVLLIVGCFVEPSEFSHSLTKLIKLETMVATYFNEPSTQLVCRIHFSKHNCITSSCNVLKFHFKTQAIDYHNRFNRKPYVSPLKMNLPIDMRRLTVKHNYITWKKIFAEHVCEIYEIHQPIEVNEQPSYVPSVRKGPLITLENQLIDRMNSFVMQDARAALAVCIIFRKHIGK